MRSAVATFMLLALAPGAPAGETEAVAFAQEHLPELARMIESLRDRSPGEFARAVRDVERARTRVERLPEGTPRRAEELRRWTLRSRMQMQAARLAALQNRPKPPDESTVAAAEARLGELAEEWVAFEQKRLTREAAALQKRLESVRKQAAEYEADPAAAAEKASQRMLRSAQNAARRKRPARSQPPKSAAGT